MSKHGLLIILSVLVPMLLVTIATVIIVAGTNEYRIPVTVDGHYVEDKNLIHIRGLIDMNIYLPGYRSSIYSIQGEANTSIATLTGTAQGKALNPRSGATILSFSSSFVYVSATSYWSISIAGLLYILGIFAGIAGAGAIIYKGKDIEVYLALIPLMIAIMSFALALLLAKMTGSIMPIGGGGGGSSLA